MKEFKRPTLKEMIGFENESFWNTLISRDYEQKIYNPFTYSLIIISCFLISSLWNRQSLIIALTLLSYILFTYVRYFKMANYLEIRRKIPSEAREGDKVSIHYELMNYSAHSIDNALFFDQFDGVQEGHINFELHHPLKGGVMRKHEVQITLDQGMGEKRFGIIEVSLSDPLKLFRFSIRFHLEQTIKVFPKIERISEMPLPYDIDSFHFGEEDVPSRGESVNFLGPRPYMNGDPVKRINWKLTIKHHFPIINTFEKNINKSILILMNTDFRLHSGEGALSTFEYTRDFVLSLMSQNMRSGNLIQLVTNDHHYPAGSGQKFINQMELEMFRLKLCEDKDSSHFVKKSLSFKKIYSGDGHSIVFITPIVLGALFEKNINDLLEFADRGHQVFIVWVEAFTYFSKRVPIGSDLSLSIHSRKNGIEKLEYELISKLKKRGIRYLKLSLKESEFSKIVKKGMEESWV